MLVLLVNDLIGISFKILEKIFAALLYMKRLKFRIGRIPLIFICFCIYIVNTGIFDQQCLGNF